MPTLVAQPTRIRAAGTKPKLIDEFIGRVNTKTSGVSVAHMRSPQGWEEPGQTPEFDEFTIVLKGTLRVKHKNGELDVAAGQAVIAHSGEWIQYSTPAGRRRRIHRGMPAGFRHGNGAPRRVSSRRIQSCVILSGVQVIRSRMTWWSRRTPTRFTELEMGNAVPTFPSPRLRRLHIRPPRSSAL